MTLDELKQIKQDMENGIVVSRATWMRVLETAIECKNFAENKDYDEQVVFHSSKVWPR